MATTRRTHILIIFAVAISSILFVGFPSAGAQETAPENLDLWLEFNGVLFFVAEDAEGDRELWTSDGTAEGTSVLTDINPNGSSSPGEDSTGCCGNHGLFAVAGDKLFFAADDGEHGVELWVTDGTATGTRLVKDITPSGSSVFYELVGVGNKLFFVYDNEETKDTARLWKSDGTTAGTVRVKSAGEAPKFPQHLYGWKDQVFFSAGGRGFGRELWKSNGKAAGTKPIKDIRKRDDGHSLSSFPSRFAAGDSRLYFVANNGFYRYNNTGIWKTDGTTKGTRYVRNVDPLRDHWDVPPYPDFLTTIGNRLFFEDDDCDHGSELWTSNGTTDGTDLIDIVPGTFENDCGPGSGPHEFRVFQSQLFFTVIRDACCSTDPPPSLWRSDGTKRGTEKVSDLPDTGYGSGTFKTVIGDTLFFIAPDGTGSATSSARFRLWKSDGTSEGTGEIDPSVEHASDLVAVGDQLFFNNRALWVSDGTEEGTRPVFGP